MPDQPPPEWNVWCDAPEFAAQLQDPRFAKLVTLARIVNNLRYHIAAAAPLQLDDSPYAVRQRMASFLNIAGGLYEALEFAKRLGRDFKGVPAFDSGLAKIRRGKSVRALMKGPLKALRHKVVHHHNEAAAQLALELLVDGQDYVFASGHSFRKVDVYYDLADIVAFRYAVNYPGDTRPFVERLKELFSDLAALTVLFGDGADALIAAHLKAVGWHTRTHHGAPDAA